jgi:LSD1 subclass zinc finger protein
MPTQLGRYRILHMLSAGGMGTVYLAEDGAIGRRVALKVPHFNADDGPEVIQRFRREARVAGAIEHPHICPIYDVGEDHGYHYLVMPFIEGAPLSQHIHSDQPWSVPRAVALIRQMALAIEVMHQKGIIHRDLKPANVMIRTSGEPVLMDFGLARSASQRMTHTGKVVGTPAYMSPEQVEGAPDELGPAADVYSLGVILFELLTGKVPFHGPREAVWGQKLVGTPRPPSAERRGLDPQLDHLCLKAMAKKTTERFASMTAFAQTLQEYLEQALLTATLPTTELRPAPAPAEPIRTRVVCPHCGAPLKLPAGSSERRVRCPKCQKALGLASEPQRPEILPRELTNSIGLKLVRIPNGKFKMGSPKGEAGQDADEMPQHDVEISTSFYLGVYSVTVSQFRQFVHETDYKTEAEMDGQGGWGYHPQTMKWEGRKPQYTWANVGWEQSNAHPVVNITWNDAIKFCDWLSHREKRPYELPTEAEWEYACRAGTTTRFYTGDDEEGLKEVANIADASLKAKLDTEYSKNWTFQTWDDGYPFTAPVGKFKPNAWGLFDMHGNVWQWCADGPRMYEEGHIKDPKDESKDRRVLRGGSWYTAPRFCRAALRFVLEPGYPSSSIGFRVVLRAAPRTL